MELTVRMNSIEEVRNYLDELVLLLKDLDAEEKLHFLIDLGKEVEEFPKELEQKENQVPGCISEAYFVLESSRPIKFQGVAHAVISQGMVGILLKVANGLNVEEFNHLDKILEKFLAESKLNVSMVPSRANAFSNMFNFMKKLVNAN